MLSYSQWLIANYADSDCPIGYLALDVSRELRLNRFPKDSTNHDEILSVLHSRNACKDAIASFEDSWKLYQLYLRSLQ